MKARAALKLSMATVGVAALLASWPSLVGAQQIGSRDIGGVVTSPAGPEAGVWVIAETVGLGTKRYAKTVVTDDQGRYLLPGLPGDTQYNIWVRGFGLVDSKAVQATPGKRLDLKAVPAPSALDAAHYYPGAYWWSMIDIPDKGIFPGTGPQGNGVPVGFQSQANWMNSMKQNGCGNCHQAGGWMMRTITPYFDRKDSMEAWAARLQSGPAGNNMSNQINGMMTPDGGLLSRLANWTDRIAAGELPAQKPARPQGVERNVVVTIWDWGKPTAYVHDLIASDKRNPTVNAWGPVYGAMELSTDWVPVVDPKANLAYEVQMPVLSPNTPRATTVNQVAGPSQHWGNLAYWESRVNAHSNVMDQNGRVWWAATVRPQWEQPAFCLKGSDHPSAKLYPITRSTGAETNTTDFVQNARQFSAYDPKLKEWYQIDTCFGTQHLNFGFDRDNTIYGSIPGGGYLGWVNTRVYFETRDAAKSQNWTPFIVDTNGNGKRDEGYVEPNDAVDPTKDKRFNVGCYGISVNRSDGSIWCSNNVFPGRFIRVDLGANAPATAITEVYEVPFPQGYGIRGFDLDSKGVAWAGGSSGNLMSFDRSKCKVLKGPTATGNHCKEGWSFYTLPGPRFKNVEGDPGVVSSPYYVWVDVHDTLGLGKDWVLVAGNQNDGIDAFKDGKWVHIAIPYPMAFFAKQLDGRIDDLNGGWSARGMWIGWGGRAPWHIEGGKGTPSFAAQFQIRPNPLANATN